MPPRIVFSTSSVFPQTDLGFRLASEFGYDGVELMVNHERRSQTAATVADLVQQYQVPVTAVHVPCLVITQPVWGWNPVVKLEKSVDLAIEVDAKVVVVHPPFRWQRDYQDAFTKAVRRLEDEHPDIEITVENMYGVEKFGKRIDPYLCTDDPTLGDFSSLCLDTSHAAANRWDPIELYKKMGADRVRHVHLSDSTSTRGDEHLPPGMGTLPLTELAQLMMQDQFDGDIVLEVATSKIPQNSRRRVTEECLEWTRNAFR